MFGKWFHVAGTDTVHDNTIIRTYGATPKTIVEKLNTALVSDLKRQETVDRFKVIGIVVQSDTPQQFRAFIAAESERWGKVIRAAGIELQRTANRRCEIHSPGRLSTRFNLGSDELANVRYWHLGDIPIALMNVCFEGKADLG